MTYEKTDNPNIIKQTQTIESSIYIDKLEKEISDLQTQIKDIPEPKTKPDQETLDFYNDNIGMEIDSEETERMLKQKQDLLSKINEL